VTLISNLSDFRELLHERLYAAYQRTGQPVPDADRPALAAKLLERRRQLERQEEILILMGERLGLQIDRRADADALIVLTGALLPFPTSRNEVTS
jgi:hypothetical protein